VGEALEPAFAAAGGFFRQAVGPAYRAVKPAAEVKDAGDPVAPDAESSSGL